MIKITICPNCDSGQIKKVRRNWTSKIQSKTYVVPNLEYYECPVCDEKVYDREAMKKIESYSLVFSKKQVEKVA